MMNLVLALIITNVALLIGGALFESKDAFGEWKKQEAIEWIKFIIPILVISDIVTTLIVLFA